jgi:hypothetical protein
VGVTINEVHHRSGALRYFVAVRRTSLRCERLSPDVLLLRSTLLSSQECEKNWSGDSNYCDARGDYRYYDCRARPLIIYLS